MKTSDYERVYEYRLPPRHRDTLKSKPPRRSMRLHQKSHAHKQASRAPTEVRAIRNVVHTSISEAY